MTLWIGNGKVLKSFMAGINQFSLPLTGTLRLAPLPIHKVIINADLRTGGRWFDPRLGQYSFRGLIIVIATGFIPLSPLSVVSTMVMCGKAASGLERISLGVLV